MAQMQQTGDASVKGPAASGGVGGRVGYQGYGETTPSEDGSGEIGLQQLVAMLSRQWRLLVAIMFAFLALAIVLCFVLTPSYTTQAIIKLDPNTPQLFNPVTAPQQKASDADQSFLDTETGIIESRGIARKVIDQFHLDKLDEFKAHHRLNVATPNDQYEGVVDNFLKNLKVKRDAGNYLITINFTSQDGNLSPNIANAIAETYLANSVAQRTETAKAQAAYLSQRLQSLSGDVQKAENLAAQFKARAGITENTTSGTVTDQQVGPIATSLATAEQEEQTAKADLAAARAQAQSGNAGAVSGVLSSLVIGDLRRQRAEASKELAAVQTRYGPKHPEYQRVTEEIRNFDKAINEETARIIAGLQAKAQSSAAQAAALRASLGRIKGEKSRNAEAAAFADSYDRDAKAKQVAYEELAHKLEEVTQAQHNQMPTGVIVERAVTPSLPTFPNIPLFAALGLVLGMLVGFATILVRELFNPNVRFAEDLTSATGAHFIVSVPKMTKKMLGRGGANLALADLILARPVSAYSEAFRTIRSTILLNQPKPPQLIAVVSALPSEGKSTVATSLARIMAANNDKVIIVDCDLRRGTVAKIAGIDPAVGLVEVLNGKTSWRDAVITHTESGLDMLPVASTRFTTSDLFSGKAMHDLIEQLRAEYQFVILDTPPVLAVSDSRVIASQADASIYVGASRRSLLRATSAAIEQLRSDNAPLLGCVLTMVDKRARRGSRKDPSYYYEEYAPYVESPA